MNELEIQIYKVDNFKHHIPKSIDEAFKAEVKKAGKRYQSIDDPYQTSSDRHEEACNNSVIDNKIFHPQDEVWLDAIQNVDVCKYKVSLPDEKPKLVNCSLDFTSLIEHELKQANNKFELIDNFPITIREYRDRIQSSRDEIYVPLEEPSAKEFVQELTKRNIKIIEDIKMNNATDTKTPDQQDTKVVFNAGDLMACLSSCDRTFLDQLILTFNDEEALNQYQYCHSTKKKQDAMYKIITKNPQRALEQIKTIQDYHHYVVNSASSVQEAKDTLKSYRDGLRAKVNDIDTNFEIKKETKDYQKEILGQMKCSKMIEEGLKGYGKAVVAGTIIGKQDQVIASANYVAVEVSKQADNQNTDDKSIDGVKTVMRNVNASINNVVASLHNEDGELNAKADSLVVETVQQRKNMTEQIEKVSAKS